MKLQSLMLALGVVVAAQAQTRQIVDMSGRTVTVPTQIRKIYAPIPYGSYMLHAVAPDLLAGLSGELRPEDKPFLNPSVLNLPVLGTRAESGSSTNLEVLFKVKPDIILQWTYIRNRMLPGSDRYGNLNNLGIPVVEVASDTMADYPTVFRFMGSLLGREARCEQLATYCQKTLDEINAVMKRIPQSRRLKVYYAQQADGLATECDDSFHVEILKLAGDCNVHRCRNTTIVGLDRVTLERVLLYNPDALVVQEKAFYDRVWSDPAWQRVKAVKNKRIYLVPRTPFNWMDRPPSFMRFLGLKWLVHNLYPKDYPLDMVRESREFYELFLGVKVSDADMQQVLYR